jgi:hypothetical protein
MTDTWNSKPVPGPKPKFLMGHRRPAPLPPGPPPVPPKGDAMLTLVKGHITAVTPLAKGHPVFLVTLKGTKAKVVVKTENIQFIGGAEDPKRSPMAAQNAKLVSQMMGSVSKGVQNIPLTASEVEALKAAPNPDPALKNAMQMVEAKQQFWVKMPFTPGLTTFGKLQKRDDLDANDIAELGDTIQRLKGNSKAWTGMGQILLVDLFIGNADRIYWEEMKVVNPGNLIFQTNSRGEIERAVGLDAYDPNAGQAGQMYGSDIEDWKRAFGSVLKNTKAYNRNADRIIESLNKWLKDKANLAGFGKNESMAVTIGMDQGHTILRQKIQAQIARGRTPSGVMARAVYLGWTK